MKRLFSHNITVLILLVILSGIVYLNSLNNGFHFDDYHHIVKNKHIRSLTNIPRFFIDVDTFSFSEEGRSHYRPLVLVSHAINYSIGRLSPVGYHIMSLVFHIGTAFLLFLIVKAILGSTPTLSLPHQGGGKKGEGSSSPFFIALSSAVIFAVHPFNSEVINYITARSSVMCGFFYLLSFYFWIRYRGHKSQIFYFASLLAFLLGILSKELMVTLPVILFLYDLYFGSVSGQDRYTRLKMRFNMSLHIIPFVLAVVIPYIIVMAHFIDSRISSPQRGYYLHMLTETKVIARYVYILFLPAGLSVDHVITATATIWETGVIGSIVLLIFLLIMAFFLYNNHNMEWKLVSFFTLWFIITLTPIVIVVLDAPLQENRGYISGAGFSVFLGVVLNRFAQRSKRRIVLKVAAFIVILILCSVITMDRNKIWTDEYTLWQDVVHKYPLSWLAHQGLGKVYYEANLKELAVKEFTMAVEIKPDYFDALYILGVVHLQRNEIEPARRMLERAVKIEPWRMNVHMRLGEVYERVGHNKQALREFEIVVRLGERLGDEETMIPRAQEHIQWLKAQNGSEVKRGI